MRLVVHVLAKIRLNLTSVDQFLSSACSLADDNPDVKERIYEAAKEARSSAMLIDHLRNLFSHQLAIESEHYESLLHYNTHQAHFQQQQQLRHSSSENVQLFTYSNQLTLIRAAKSLVANVAKVLYLADSTVLQSDKPPPSPYSDAFCERSGDQLQQQRQDSASYQQQQQQQQQHEKMLIGSRGVSDRLDNVANYSQLLRSFGELSADMVDLGQCIMLSSGAVERDRQTRLRDNWLGATTRRPSQHSLGPLMSAEQSAALDPRVPLSLAQNNQHHHYQHRSHHQIPVSSSSMQLHQQQLHLDAYNPATNNRRQHRVKSTTAAAAATDNEELSPTSSLTFADNNIMSQMSARLGGVNNALLSNSPALSADDNDATTWTTGETTLKSQIQDMQILFQVNRLIIDRSILILLSASKCCLRQGSEYLSGLETRRSVVVQIRASISIIMAIIKCSIFSQRPTSAATAASVFASVHKVHDSSARQFHATNLPFAGPQAPTTTTTTTTTWLDHQLNMNNNNSSNNNNHSSTTDSVQATRDNQFDYRRLCQSATAGAAYCSASAHLAEHPAQQLDTSLERHWQSQSHLPLDLLAAAEGGAGHLPQGGGGGAVAEIADSTQLQTPPLQIMNYFLQTWSGTQSAHDAVNKLQLLVAPFEQIGSHAQLMEALGASIRRHRHSAAKQQQVTVSPGAQRARQQYRHWPPSDPVPNIDDDCDKENQQGWTGADAGARGGSSLLDGSNGGPMSSNSLSLFLMNKRQLINALNSLFLGELKTNLVERAQEFTDCAYTKHEHRETIVQLIHCIKLLLNKLVKLLYRSQRRKTCAQSAIEEQQNLGQLRQVASLLGDTCAELDYELQAVVIEQSDELDKCNSQTELIKQMKHHCLVGDVTKSQRICAHFNEQSEQLVELCKMLNQVSPTHKMKITSKSLALWFELNASNLINLVQCLAENPRSRALKDCAWAYIQVWCSFYDDFCQLARQVAYLTHAQADNERQVRVANLRDQILMRRQNHSMFQQPGQRYLQQQRQLGDEYLLAACADQSREQQCLTTEDSCASRLMHATSVQSLNLAEVLSDATNADSPRSLDHYYGFGNNYHQQTRQRRGANGTGKATSPEESHILRGDETADCCLVRQSASPRLCFDSSGNQTPPLGQIRGYNSPCSSGAESAHLTNFGAMHSVARADDLTMYPSAANQPSFRAATLNDPLGDAGVRRHRHQRRGPNQQPQVQFAIDERQQQHQRRQLRSYESRQQPGCSMAMVPQAADPADESTLEDVDAQVPAVPAPGAESVAAAAGNNTDQQSSTTEADKWSDSDADAIVRGAKETAQMALSMYQFTKGEGDLNTTQDLFTQAELFAEEANELYKEVRCFSYKVPAGELKKELLAQLGTIPALVQQLQFIVKNPTVGKPATFAKVDSVIRETRSLMDAVNRVVTATLSCRQHYNMAIASMRKRTRTLSPSYRGDKGFEFEDHLSARQSAIGSRSGGGGMGSEPDI